VKKPHSHLECNSLLFDDPKILFIFSLEADCHLQGCPPCLFLSSSIVPGITSLELHPAYFPPAEGSRK